MENFAPRTSLKDYPELAKTIGIIVAEYGLLELQMYLVFGILSDSKPEDSYKEFFHLQKSHLRKELILKAAAKAQIKPEYLKALNRLLRRFASAANRRTEIAHASYAIQKGKMHRLRFVLGEPVLEPVTDAVLQRTVNQYHILHNDLLAFAALIGDHDQKGHQVVRSLPLPTSLDMPPTPLANLHPPEQSLLEQIEASLSRLGLAHLFVR